MVIQYELSMQGKNPLTQQKFSRCFKTFATFVTSDVSWSVFAGFIMFCSFFLCMVIRLSLDIFILIPDPIGCDNLSHFSAAMFCKRLISEAGFSINK